MRGAPWAGDAKLLLNNYAIGRPPTPLGPQQRRCSVFCSTLLPGYCRQRGREEKEEKEDQMHACGMQWKHKRRQERPRIWGLWEAALLPVALSCIGTAPALSVGGLVSVRVSAWLRGEEGV